MRNPLPENQIAEKAVVGAAVSDGRTADSVLEALTPEQFVLPAHQCIMGIVAAMRQAARPVDVILVTTELEKAGQLE